MIGLIKAGIVIQDSKLSNRIIWNTVLGPALPLGKMGLSPMAADDESMSWLSRDISTAYSIFWVSF